MDRKSVLVADDEELIRDRLERFLTSRGFDVECADSGEGVIGRLAQNKRPSVMILDMRMPRLGGIEVLEEMEKRRVHIPTIVLSGMDQVSTVVRAIKLGASDYLPKPFEERALERAIQNALGDEHDHAEPIQLFDAGEVPSRNQRMVRIRKIAAEVADTDVPVLILGESGVGKELLARYIHMRSERRTQPFVKVNCAALPVDLLESEMFGYERGAFTGAMRDRPGKFELAGRGTILLDEIGEMSANLQAKLLHVLQDGEYTRLGGSQPARAEARVLAATNQRLEEAVAKGTFREDLYFRLNVIRLEMVPLRDRPEDILPLCGYFLEKYRTKYQRPHRMLSPETMSTLETYSWPGNIRQLENVVKRIVILPDPEYALADLVERPAHSHATHVADCLPEAPRAPIPSRRESATDKMSLKKASALAAEQIEKEMVMRTLQEVSWNRKQAARQLSISYKALLNKLRRWQVAGRSAGTHA
jgi:two-component system, NtrC family, response regulator AtoC